MAQGASVRLSFTVRKIEGQLCGANDFQIMENLCNTGQEKALPEEK